MFARNVLRHDAVTGSIAEISRRQAGRSLAELQAGTDVSPNSSHPNQPRIRQAVNLNPGLKLISAFFKSLLVIILAGFTLRVVVH
jgi:hypothetical protein